MEQNIQTLVLTSLTAPELRNLFRTEIEKYFIDHPLSKSGFINDNDIIFDIDEAAAYIKLSIPSIYRLVGENSLPVIKKGKKLLFQKTALTSWLMEGRRMTLKEIEKDSKREIQAST